MNTIWIPAMPIVPAVEAPDSPFQTLASFSRAKLAAGGISSSSLRQPIMANEYVGATHQMTALGLRTAARTASAQAASVLPKRRPQAMTRKRWASW